MKNGIIAILIAFAAIMGIQDKASAEQEPFKFRAASLNIQAGGTLAGAAQDANKAAQENADAIAFQEIGGDAKAKSISNAIANEGYTLVRLNGDPDNPIAYKESRWNKIDAFTYHLSDRTFVRVPGAGPRWMAENHVTVVVLKNKAGEQVAFVSLHLVPQPELNRERAELHALQMSRLAKLSEKLQNEYPRAHQVFAGDYNTGEIERYEALTDRGMNVSENVQTHQNGPLDHVVSSLKMGWTYVGARNLNTDHDLLVVNLKEN